MGERLLHIGSAGKAYIWECETQEAYNHDTRGRCQFVVGAFRLLFSFLESCCTLSGLGLSGLFVGWDLNWLMAGQAGRMGHLSLAARRWNDITTLGWIGEDGLPKVRRWKGYVDRV